MSGKFFSQQLAASRAVRAWVAALGFVSILIVCQTVLIPEGLARETYVQFAKRMAQPPAGMKLRHDLEQQLLAQANSYRASQGVKPLSGAGDFLLAARAQAADMALNNFVGHRSSHGEEFSSRMSALMGGGMLMMPHMAENAARDSQPGAVDNAKASRLFQQWVNSPPHRKALVNRDFKFVSTAVVQRDNKIYAIQIFWAQLPAGVKVIGAEGAPASAGEVDPPVAASPGASPSLY